MQKQAGKMGQRTEVAIVGELNLDLILEGLPRDLPEERELLASNFTMTLGSSSAIMAHNLALLGMRVSFSSRIGPDPLGKLCCQWLQEAGVDITQIRCVNGGSNTGVTLILPLVATRRILTYPGAMSEMGIDDLDTEYLATAKHFHLSSFFLHRALTSHLPELFAAMKRSGLTTSLDTNDDPRDEWDSGLKSVFRELDILFCNEREILKIAGVQNADDAAERIAAAVPLLIVKRGPRGASLYANGQRMDAPAISVPVQDTVGAGDTFDAGFLYQWLREAPVEQCLAFANVAAALSTTRAGGVAAFKDSDYREKFLALHSPRAS
jgi:sugar/nucleoside kinase (ribokinase family)